VVGLNARHLELLPLRGPAMIVANHNSHLDALILLSLFPLRRVHHVRPVAAADYFLRNRVLAWFSLHMLRIIPIERDPGRRQGDPLAAVSVALEQGEIIILFPEGSRGRPEELSAFRSGIAHLSRKHPEVPITPVFLHGLGKVLPKGEALLVPFFCDLFVGEPLHWSGDKSSFMDALSARFAALAAEGNFPPWT
jgi:1-acyl-sn-glycerol-3-phosphate acyltransferase